MSDQEYGLINIKGFDLPHSIFLEPETRENYCSQAAQWKEYDAKLLEACSSLDEGDSETYSAIRKCQAKFFHLHSRECLEARARYEVKVSHADIGGVYTEVFTPEQGVSAENSNRVLINLHGGGFLDGSRTYSHVESIPIAATGSIKVISVDYRMAPEYRFPAATDDIVAVYKVLLGNYQPHNIGIYGSSAGALLTAQTIARLEREGIAKPGAIGMFSAGAYFWGDGDSGYIASALQNFPVESLSENVYFEGVDCNNALAFPGKSPEIMERFPRSLLISSTRDFAMSSVVHTHTQLTKLGVKADLHMWDGLEHVFQYDSSRRESQDAYKVIAKYFRENLGCP